MKRALFPIGWLFGLLVGSWLSQGTAGCGGSRCPEPPPLPAIASYRIVDATLPELIGGRVDMLEDETRDVESRELLLTYLQDGTENSISWRWP